MWKKCWPKDSYEKHNMPLRSNSLLLYLVVLLSREEAKTFSQNMWFFHILNFLCLCREMHNNESLNVMVWYWQLLLFLIFAIWSVWRLIIYTNVCPSIIKIQFIFEFSMFILPHWGQMIRVTLELWENFWWQIL